MRSVIFCKVKVKTERLAYVLLRICDPGEDNSHTLADTSVYANVATLSDHILKGMIYSGRVLKQQTQQYLVDVVWNADGI